MVSLQQGGVEAAALHGARVDKKNLLRPCGPVDSGASQKAMDSHSTVLNIDFQESLLPVPPENRGHSFFERSPGRVLPEYRSIPAQHPAHLRASQRRQPHPLLDMTPLRLLGAQKFSPARHMGEELAHLDTRTGGTASLTGAHHLASVDHHLSTLLRLRLTSLEGETTHGGNARKRLPAETKGLNLHQVSRFADLAGGMPLQGQQGIFRPHPAAVIGHPN